MRRRLAVIEQSLQPLSGLSTLSGEQAFGDSHDAALEARKRRCRVNAPNCRTAHFCTVCGRNQYRLCRLGRSG